MQHQASRNGRRQTIHQCSCSRQATIKQVSRPYQIEKKEHRENIEVGEHPSIAKQVSQKKTIPKVAGEHKTTVAGLTEAEQTKRDRVSGIADRAAVADANVKVLDERLGIVKMGSKGPSKFDKGKSEQKRRSVD